MRLFIAFCFSLTFLTSFGIYNKDSEKKLLKSARKHFLFGEYDKAIEDYRAAIKINPQSPDLYFELGLCYFEGELGKEKALGFFQEALKNSNKDTIPELLYYLGQAYQFNQEFEQAIVYYKLFDKKLTNSSDGQELRKETNGLLTMCQSGEVLLSSFNENMIIENLGNTINTEFSEYAPVVNKSGNLLLFTGRRRGSSGGEIFYDNKFFEDIYASNLVDSVWSSPQKIDETSQYTASKLNFVYHDAAIAFNNDENSLYIYRDNDIWEASIIDNRIGEPKRLNEIINTSEHEPSVYLTPDGNTLVMVSNKQGGYGGRDLYLSTKKSDGSWSDVKNMGDKINTENDDDAPFISSDGKTLFFSSKGHNSIGGYDIFKSTLNEKNEWSEPINLGLPINSPGDDIFYVEDGRGVAYFSSDRAGGLGSMDIYRIKSDDVSKPKDSIIASNFDSLLAPVNTESSILTSIFKINYDYNVFGIKEDNEDYKKFISEALIIAKQNGKLILEIESSASKVPTTTYNSNHNLAKVRLNEAAEKIKNDLLKSGLNKEQIHFEVFNATVQGPAYKDDFESNKSAYLPFQYVRVLVK